MTAVTVSNAFGQAAAPASPSPSASPTLPPYTPPPTPPPPAHAHRLTLSGSSSLVFMDSNYIGSGLVPPEATAFIAGLPFAPGTPYDFFSGAPTGPGIAIGQNIKVDVAYGPAAVNYGVTLGFGSVSGSGTSVGYWGEQPLPTINPHLGQTSYAIPIAFVTKPGLDDVSGVRGSILGGFVRTKDNNAALTFGWLDLHQTNGFVFKQAPVTNSSPALAVVVPNSLGNGSPVLDGWLPSDIQLPINGIDLYGKQRNVAIELTDGTLPAPAGVGAHFTNASFDWSRDNGPHFGAQIVHISTGGPSIATTTLYGMPIFGTAFPNDPFGQGPIPFTSLQGQQNTVWGVTGTGALSPLLDGTFEVGASTYTAQPVSVPSGTPAWWVHGGFAQHLSQLTLSEDYYWVDPRYAPTILPYGIPEDIWSAAYTWPAQWLRGDYQSIDNTTAYNDRRGYKFKLDYEGDLFQTRASYSVLSQSSPINMKTGTTAGFVEGYYLPELTTTGGTLGIDRQLALWLFLHPRPADVSIDYVSQNNYRPAFVSSADAVAMRYPSLGITLSRKMGEKFLLAGGFSHMTVAGTWAGGPVNVDQGVQYIGFQYIKSPSQEFQVQARGYRTHGSPILTDTAGPMYNGLQILIEQKAKI